MIRRFLESFLQCKTFIETVIRELLSQDWPLDGSSRIISALFFPNILVKRIHVRNCARKRQKGSVRRGEGLFRQCLLQAILKENIDDNFKQKKSN